MKKIWRINALCSSITKNKLGKPESILMLNYYSLHSYKLTLNFCIMSSSYIKYHFFMYIPCSTHWSVGKRKKPLRIWSHIACVLNKSSKFGRFLNLPSFVETHFILEWIMLFQIRSANRTGMDQCRSSVLVEMCTFRIRDGYSHRTTGGTDFPVLFGLRLAGWRKFL